MEDHKKIANLHALLRLMAHYDSHDAFDHDRVKDEKACNHCKLLKRVHKELWGLNG